MYQVNVGADKTVRLDHVSAAKLLFCDYIEYKKESGWIVAYGYDADDKVVIMVHAENRAAFERYLNPDEFFEREQVVTTWGSVLTA